MKKMEVMQRLIFIAFVIVISACVSKESIVIPPAKPFEHPQLESLSSQTIITENDIIKFGDNKKYTKNNITESISRLNFGNGKWNRHSVLFNSNDFNFWIAMQKEPSKVPASFETYTGFNLSKELYGQGMTLPLPTFQQNINDGGTYVPVFI